MPANQTTPDPTGCCSPRPCCEVGVSRPSGEPSADQVRGVVRERYARVADNSACCPDAEVASCSGSSSPDKQSQRLGYSEGELASIPGGANMGLGCGNPQAIASLQPGEVVVDLGSGGGLDCFLAAKQVGDTGLVIGVDMTPEMLSKARALAESEGYTNVEFRLGEIEHLPIADGTADVILSNCVINLSPDKPQVYRDAFRVLRPGGRLAISDVVRLADFPDGVRDDPKLLCACISGAASKDELLVTLEAAGFTDIAITLHRESREFIKDWDPGSNIEDYICSATVEAKKPAPA